MPVPDFQSLMLPVLKAVSDGPIAAQEVRAKVAQYLQLGESDLGELLLSGRQSTFANRTAWANIFLQRAELIRVVRRGVYEITEAGKLVLGENPPRIDMKYLERFPSYSEWRSRSIRGESGEIESQDRTAVVETPSTNPEEQIERSHRELTAAVEADVLERLRHVSPAQF